MGQTPINWKTIAWEDFQTLCCRLLQRVLRYDVRPRAVKGADGGIDAVGYAQGPSPRTIVMQSKHWTSHLSLSAFTSQVNVELKKIGERHIHLDHYILMTSYPLSTRMREWFEGQAHAYPFSIECIDGPVMENWLAEQHDIRQEFFGIPIARHSWESLRDVCFKRSTARLAAMRETKKYISELYIDRPVQTEFGKFLNSQAACFIVVGKAGEGKTNLLCRLTEQHLSDVPCLLLLGSSIILNSERALVQRVLSELLFDENVNVEVAGENLASVLVARGQHMLVLIDAINENPSIERMRPSLEYLTEFIRDKRIKLCISCRDIFWDFFKDCFIESDVYGPTESKDVSSFVVTREKRDKPVSVLTDFSDSEFVRASEQYFSYFSILGSITEEAEERLHHPILLRFFCEAYAGQNIGIKEDIHLLELFDLYWARKLENIRITMGLRTDQNLRVFLLTVSRLMREKRANTLLVSEVVGQTGTDADSAQSIYTRILDENIILEEEMEEPQGTRIVRFVYDEFFEYVIARGLWEQYGARLRGKRMLQEEIFSLAEGIDSFRNLAGAVQYLLLMIEKKDKELFLELLRGLACRRFTGLSMRFICMILDRIETLGPQAADVFREWVANRPIASAKPPRQLQPHIPRSKDSGLLRLAEIYPDVAMDIHVLIENRVESRSIKGGYSVKKLTSAIESLARHRSYVIKRAALNEMLWMTCTKRSVAIKVLRFLTKSRSAPVRQLVNNTALAMGWGLLDYLPTNKQKRHGQSARIFARELAKTSQHNYVIWYLEGMHALRHRVGKRLNTEDTLTYLSETSRFISILRESINTVLGELTELERTILECRFGLDLPGPMTISETARFLHLSPTTIRKREGRALRKLRHPTRSRLLKEYLSCRRLFWTPEYLLLCGIFGHFEHRIHFVEPKFRF
jgi:DNA-binding CsgD family transcriptional regulator